MFSFTKLGRVRNTLCSKSHSKTAGLMLKTLLVINNNIPTTNYAVSGSCTLFISIIDVSALHVHC